MSSTYLKEWRKRNPDKTKEYNARSNAKRVPSKNTPELRAYKKLWREKNKDRLIEYRRFWRAERKRKAFERFGSKCVRCGFFDVRALQIDHVNGGGVKENRKDRGSNFYVKVLEDMSGKYQLLCANCNWIKRYENKEYKSWGKEPI